MAVKRRIAHPSVEERRAHGKEARSRTPLSSHTGWGPAADRPDPVGLLEEQNRAREPDLVPVRHGRMLVSPFTFYRGGAKIMAADLKDNPSHPPVMVTPVVLWRPTCHRRCRHRGPPPPPTAASTQRQPEGPLTATLEGRGVSEHNPQRVNSGNLASWPPDADRPGAAIVLPNHPAADDA
jgi:hypothetical protein